MPYHYQYTEAQLTPWFRMTTSPLRSGMYQIRSLASGEISEAWFLQGRWNLKFGLEMSPFRLNLQNYEWRGLNEEPVEEPIWDKNGVMHIS